MSMTTALEDTKMFLEGQIPKMKKMLAEYPNKVIIITSSSLSHLRTPLRK